MSSTLQDLITVARWDVLFMPFQIKYDVYSFMMNKQTNKKNIGIQIIGNVYRAVNFEMW